ncbi:MAG: antibiotic biosynthesis monooxygenase [Ilumatobacteraceae bacterium]
MSTTTQLPGVVTAVTAVEVRQGEDGAFAGWLTQFNTTIATFPGYVSAVVIPPVPPLQTDWVMVQRFQTIDELRAWMDSRERRALLDESASLLVDEGTTNVIQGTNSELSEQDMVTEIITVSVKPGMEDAYRAWVDRVRPLEAGFPGYQGLQMQAPIPGLQDHWVSLLRFDTSAHLNAWLGSDARRDALREVEPFIDKREQQVATSFSGWFTFGNAPGRSVPSWKQSMIVLLTLFPIVMLERLYLNPHLDSLDSSVATFIGNALSVAATGFLLIPYANRAFEWWLLPAPRDTAKVEAAGIGLVLAGYALSIFVFILLS